MRRVGDAECSRSVLATSWPIGSATEDSATLGDAPVVWVSTPVDTSVRGVASAVESELVVRGARCLSVDGEEPLPIAFSSARRLLEPLVPRLARRAPSLLESFAPELVRLLPGLESHPLLAGSPRLDSIALGGTKRRLHKESEKLFRVVYAFASLVLEASRCGDDDQTLCLIVRNFDAVDRLSLSCLYHLAQRIRSESLRLILVGPEPRRRRFPWLWTVAAETETVATGEMAAACATADQATEIHRDLVDAFVRGLRPEIVPRATTRRASPGFPVDAEVQTAFLLRLVGAPESVWRSELEGAAVPELPEREVAQPLYRDLPSAARRSLHRTVAVRLPRVSAAAEASIEETLVQAAFHRLRAGDVETGVPLAARAARTMFGFSQNYEGVVLLCHAILSIAETESSVRAYQLQARLLLGLCCTYLGRHERALAWLEGAGPFHDPAVRGQVCYYTGLILAKRLGRLEEATARFAEGLHHLDGVESDAARLERGWLLNGTGFVLWKRGELPAARSRVEESLREAGRIDGDQARNLEVNLINNLSLLHEGMGDAGEALRVWEQLEPIAAAAPSTAGKSYQYRRGWLLLLSNRLAEAAAALDSAHGLAAEVRDLFHMDLISRACGYVACRQREFEEAYAWLRRNHELRRRLGDASGAAVALAQLGHAAIQGGDRDLALRALDDAASRADDAGLPRHAVRFRAARDDLARLRSWPRLDVDDVFHGIGLDLPRAKLTSPFHVADLSTPRAFEPWSHRSLTSTQRPTGAEPLGLVRREEHHEG